MSITNFPPNTINLGGRHELINDLVAGEALKPGHLIEMYNNSGTLSWRKHTATGALAQGRTYCLERSMLNEGVTDAVSSGDTVEAGIFTPGAKVLARIASGQNITQGDYLQSAGNGTLAIFSTGAKVAQARETKASVTVETLIRVDVF